MENPDCRAHVNNPQHKAEIHIGYRGGGRNFLTNGDYWIFSVQLRIVFLLVLRAMCTLPLWYVTWK